MSASVDTPTTRTAPPVPTRKPVRRARRSRRLRRNSRLVFAVTHRWVSLVLGLALVAVTTSGAAVLYEGDWQRLVHPEVYRSTPTATPVGFDAALAAVRNAQPDFEPGTVNVYGGVYEVSSVDGDAHPGIWAVDPGTGAVTGHVDSEHGVMAFMVNLHECALSCEGYPGYLPFLSKPIPGTSGFFADVTWSGAVLALMGVLLAFLALSGLVLWWPGLKRWAHGFRVRWKQNRYTRDYDVHQLAGLLAVPFLLMWALTGTSFELPLDDAWYAVTGGVVKEDPPEFTSKEAPAGTPDLTADQAVAAATRVAAGTPVYVSAPSEEGAAGAFSVWLSAGVDPYEYGHGPGQVEVMVDRHDANHTREDYSAHAPTLSNQIWDVWRSGMLHYGYAVNGWWRIIWFAFGMAPLLLAVTGVSTWLYKRGVRRRRRQALAARAADPRFDEQPAAVAP